MPAKPFATLDHLSGGRLIVGIGAGHLQGEFDALGLDFAERGRALDAAPSTLGAALENEFVDGFGAPSPTHPSAAPADLDRRIVAAGTAPRCTVRGRLAAPGSGVR